LRPTFSHISNPRLLPKILTGRQHYRLYTINKIPTLKVLDFIKVKASEREKGKRLAMSAAGAALEGDVQTEARDAKSNANTFNPGEGKSAKESFVANFTPEQKAQIKDMIANAPSPAEIERIEECVKRGEFPDKTSDDNSNGNVQKENGNGEKVSKKQRTS
jgi:U2 small nuclear ribonucleoprotein A'